MSWIDFGGCADPEDFPLTVTAVQVVSSTFLLSTVVKRDDDACWSVDIMILGPVRVTSCVQLIIAAKYPRKFPQCPHNPGMEGSETQALGQTCECYLRRGQSKFIWSILDLYKVQGKFFQVFKSRFFLKSFEHLNFYFPLALMMEEVAGHKTLMSAPESLRASGLSLL